MKNTQNIIILILAGLILYNIFLNNTIKTNVQEYEDKIDLLQTKVDSVNSLNKELDSKINNLNNQITLIDTDIDNVQSNITTIKTKTNEKINSVDSFTYSDLEQFFADRYKERFNSAPEAVNSKVSN